MIPKTLIAISAGMLFLLGAVHLAYTFWGSKLTPRDTTVQSAMNETSPVISNENTMWRVWTGINTTHSMFLILFGFIYGYLAFAQSELFFRSPSLMILGGVMLLALAVVCRLYFFSTPFYGVCIALICYAAGIVIERISR